MKYQSTIEYFMSQHRETVGLNGDIQYAIIALDERQLSSVIKIKFFNTRQSKVFFIKISEDQNFIMWGGNLSKEYAILKKVRANNMLHTTVPFPVAFSSEHSALMTQDVEAEEAITTINKSLGILSISTTTQSAINLVSNCGHWLKQFHQFIGIKKGQYNFEPAIRWVGVRLNLLLKHNAEGVDDVWCQKILKKLTVLKKEIDKQEITLSGNHSDFCPHNILLKENNDIVVIDFASYAEGPIEYDILRYYNELENIGYQFLCSSKKADILKYEFLTAYGYDIDFTAPLTQFILCQYKVAKLLSSWQSGCSYSAILKNGRAAYDRNYLWLQHEFCK